MTRHDDEYDDDPRGQHVYSPEASDTQRLGGWQSKAAVMGAIGVLVIVVWFLI